MGGNPSPNPAHRNLGFSLHTLGWEEVLRQFYQPAVDAGVARILVATPFGQRSLVLDPVTGNYFDAIEEVPNQNATRDFVSAWQDFIADNEAAGKEIDAIVYIGSPRHDPDMTALINTPAAWWDRAYDVLEPLFEAGFPVDWIRCLRTRAARYARLRAAQRPPAPRAPRPRPGRPADRAHRR
jgi:hypothetical protein